MKLHAAVRADLREVGQAREGRRVAMKVVKNQLAAPGQAELTFVEGEVRGFGFAGSQVDDAARPEVDAVHCVFSAHRPGHTGRRELRDV